MRNPAPTSDPEEEKKMKRLMARLRSEERGDVPGWVLITAMTAGLVIAIWALAGSTLTQVFTNAVNSVMTGP